MENEDISQIRELFEMNKPELINNLLEKNNWKSFLRNHYYKQIFHTCRMEDNPLELEVNKFIVLILKFLH